MIFFDCSDNNYKIKDLGIGLGAFIKLTSPSVQKILYY